VARQVRDTVVPCPLLVAVTAYGGTYTKADATGPFDHYLVKPADPFELERLLRESRDLTGRKARN
jgi:CheY-like chemotaxis protein